MVDFSFGGVKMVGLVVLGLAIFSLLLLVPFVLFWSFLVEEISKDAKLFVNSS